MKHPSGQQITNRSFEIIRERLGDYRAPDLQMEIVIRIAHTTGDVEFAKTFLFHEEPVRRGIEALLDGANVLTDVEMVRTGIRAGLIEPLGGRILCFLNDPGVVEEAARLKTTRSALGMRAALSAMAGGIVTIGNAPTALFELCEMVDQGLARPAVVVGVPVGFVGALEAKQELAKRSIPHITNLGERGGSPIAAAVVNGMLARAALMRGS